MAETPICYLAHFVSEVLRLITSVKFANTLSCLKDVYQQHIYFGDLNKVYWHDCKILERHDREVMKSYLILHEYLMLLYYDPRKIISSADAEPQEKINAVSVVANLAVSIVKIQQKAVTVK